MNKTFEELAMESLSELAKLHIEQSDGSLKIDKVECQTFWGEGVYGAGHMTIEFRVTASVKSEQNPSENPSCGAPDLPTSQT